MKLRTEVKDIIQLLMIAVLIINFVANLFPKCHNIRTQQIIDDLSEVRTILEELKKT